LDGLLELPEKIRSQWTVPKVFLGQEVPHIRNIFIHPDDSNLVFAVLEHGGLVCSRDQAKTWEDTSTGIAYLDMHVLAIIPEKNAITCLRRRVSSGAMTVVVSGAE
jgi:hypothetical protein